MISMGSQEALMAVLAVAAALGFPDIIARFLTQAVREEDAGFNEDDPTLIDFPSIQPGRVVSTFRRRIAE
jgi:hypothetical protein